MGIFILSGAIGDRSCTRILLRHLEEVLRDKGLKTTFWDLATKPLPIAIPEYHTRQHEHPEQIVRDFVNVVKQADGYILGSPLYHDSFSGVLKNALDSLPNEAFLHKPVGLVSHSSNVRSCVAPCNQLRPVVRSLGGYSTHMQIGTTDADYRDEQDYTVLVSDKIKHRAQELSEELIELTKLLK